MAEELLPSFCSRSLPVTSVHSIPGLWTPCALCFGFMRPVSWSNPTESPSLVKRWWNLIKLLPWFIRAFPEAVPMWNKKKQLHWIFCADSSRSIEAGPIKTTTVLSLKRQQRFLCKLRLPRRLGRFHLSGNKLHSPTFLRHSAVGRWNRQTTQRISITHFYWPTQISFVGGGGVQIVTLQKP